jgi:hypothetical protein
MRQSSLISSEPSSKRSSPSTTSSSPPRPESGMPTAKLAAGIRVGHRHDVASDIVQADVQLRIRAEDFDNRQVPVGVQDS